MNKLSFLSILLVSTFISCHAQRSQERSISAFTKIKISGAVNVIYTNSDTLNLTVKGKENDVAKVETKVEGSTLVISSKGSHGELDVYVKNNQLYSLESSGATSFKTTNFLKNDSIYVSLSGAAEAEIKINSGKIKCTEEGASNLVLEGTANYLDADISSAAALKSYRLVAKEAVIVTSGAASAKVYVTEKLKATATSASDIKVKGDPKDVTAETSTSASITRLKDLSVTDDKSEGDTTYINLRKRKILIVENSDGIHVKSSDNADEAFKHWRGFSMAVNGYMGAGGGITLPKHNRYMDLDYRHSFNLQFNIIERQFNIVKNYFKIVTGFGFDYHMYELANKTSLNADSSYTSGMIDSTNQYSYKKNRLRCTYLQVPLLLEFNTSNDPHKTFHIAFGVVGQFLISSRTKQVLMEGKDETTHVRKDNYNMSPFAAKALVNLGYRSWTFFAEYSLTPLFQSGKGPELYPFTAGLRVVPFG